MTAQLRIAYKNGVDHPECVLTCDTGGILLPLDNLKNMVRNRLFRITEPGAAILIKGTYGGSGIYASMASIARHNLQPAATWRFRGYGTVDWTGATVADTGALAAVDAATLGELTWGVDPLGIDQFDPLMGQKMSTAWFARALILSWTIEISDIGNTDGVLDVSRAWVAEYHELDHNPEYNNLPWGWMEKSETWRTDGGSPRTDAAVPYRGGSFDLKVMPEADRAFWHAATRYCGLGRRDFHLSFFPDDASSAIVAAYSCNAIFQGALPRPNWTEGDYFETQVTVEEV